MRRPSTFRPEVRKALPVLIGLRLVANTGGRMVFSFLPQITRGTGLSVEAMGRVIFARDLTGLAATVVGARSDRSGNWRAMWIGGLAIGIGLLLSALGAVGIAVGMVLYGFGRLGVHIGMNAWIADEVAYERRGEATGLLELTWAGAALIGIPTCGVLIDLLGWRAPFLILGLLSVALTLAQRPAHSSTAETEAAPGGRPIFTANIAATLIAPAILLGAAQFLFFGHGLWLEETYDFNAARIGFAVIALGAAEAVGSMASSRFTDRLGKRRSLLGGGIVMVLAMAAMYANTAPPLPVGLGLLVLAFFGFEFAIVSSIPLVAELSVGSRGQMIGWSVGLSTVVKAVVSLVAGSLYARHGFELLVAMAIVFAIVSTAITALVIREPRPAGGGPDPA